MSLRSKLILLARNNPGEVRDALLPLLSKQAAHDLDSKIADWAFQGNTLITELQRDPSSRVLDRSDHALFVRIKKDLLELSDIVAPR